MRNDALLQTGSVRIGTLHDYRKAEHKPGIADAQEGLKWVHHRIDQWNFADEVPGTPSLHAKTSSALGVNIDYSDLPPGQKPSGSIRNVRLMQFINDPNCFVHCTSYELSKEVMAEFKDADSCVEIYNQGGFYKTLTAAINKHTPVKWGGTHIVHYQNRFEAYNGEDLGLPASVVKGVEFSGQYEVRAIWHPLEHGPIDWMPIDVPELTRFCRRVKVKDR
jgi:hypothetical protein